MAPCGAFDRQGLIGEVIDVLSCRLGYILKMLKIHFLIIDRVSAFDSKGEF